MAMIINRRLELKQIEEFIRSDKMRKCKMGEKSEEMRPEERKRVILKGAFAKKKSWVVSNS